MSWNMDIFEQLRENGRSPQPTPIIHNTVIGMEYNPREDDEVRWYEMNEDWRVITYEEYLESQNIKYGGMI